MRRQFIVHILEHLKKLDFSLFIKLFSTYFTHVGICIYDLTICSYTVEVIFFGHFEGSHIIFNQGIFGKCVLNNFLYVGLDLSSYFLGTHTWNPVFIDQTVNVFHIRKRSFFCYLSLYKWKGKDVDVLPMDFFVDFDHLSCNLVVLNY